MHRLLLSFAVISTLLIGIIATQPHLSTVAADHDDTPVAADQHPLIGAWLGDTDAANPDNAPSLLIFHADGTFVELEEGASDGIGSWEATGPNTANLTIYFPNVDETGAFVGYAKVRVQIEVDETGNRFTAPYTLEFIGADGSSAGELGPTTATAERIAVEEMGTPVGPLPGAPAATPAA